MLTSTLFIFFAILQFSTLVACGLIQSFGDAESPVLELRAPSSWVHPGILVDAAQLNFVKSKVAANADPWASAYSDMVGSSE